MARVETPYKLAHRPERLSTQFARSYSGPVRTAILDHQASIAAGLRAYLRKLGSKVAEHGATPLSARSIIEAPETVEALRLFLTGSLIPLYTLGHAEAMTGPRRFAEPTPAEILAGTANLPPELTRRFSPLVLSRMTPLQLRALAALYADFGPISAGVAAGVSDGVAAIIGNGIAEGWSRARMTRAIQTAFYNISEVSARRIAQTETIRATAQGRVEALRGNPLTRWKEWQAAPDACEDCEAMGGQVVEVDEPFVSPSGEEFDTPPFHPNCRCGVTGSVEGP